MLFQHFLCKKAEKSKTNIYFASSVLWSSPCERSEKGTIHTCHRLHHMKYLWLQTRVQLGPHVKKYIKIKTCPNSHHSRGAMRFVHKFHLYLIFIYKFWSSFFLFIQSLWIWSTDPAWTIWIPLCPELEFKLRRITRPCLAIQKIFDCIVVYSEYQIPRYQIPATSLKQNS